jgi:hypothetical protein
MVSRFQHEYSQDWLIEHGPIDDWQYLFSSVYIALKSFISIIQFRQQVQELQVGMILTRPAV